MGMRHSVFDSNLALHLILDGVGVIGDGTHGVDDGVQQGERAPRRPEHSSPLRVGTSMLTQCTLGVLAAHPYAYVPISITNQWRATPSPLCRPCQLLRLGGGCGS